MEEEDQRDPNAVNFIPCLCFVRRGVAKENPDKVSVPAATWRIVLILFS